MREQKEEIKNYAYAGFVINKTRRGFEVSVPNKDRSVIYIANSLVSAKIYIDSFTDTEQKKIIKTEGRILKGKEND